MHFRITGLPAEHFAHLFDLSDDELSLRGAVRLIADGRTPGYPCRVSLTDAQEGDELLLVNYEHHPVASPYRMRFAVYVRRGEETYDAVDEVLHPQRVRVDRDRAWQALQRDKKGPLRIVLLGDDGGFETQLPAEDVRAALDELIAG